MKQTSLIIVGIIVLIIIGGLWLSLGSRKPADTVPVVTGGDNVEPAPTNAAGNQTNPYYVSNDLAGEMWELSGAQNDTDEDLIDAERAASFVLTFATDGTFSATTDCNTLRGQYELTETGIGFSTIASTKMACGEESAEQTFVEVLTGTQSYTISETVPRELILESSAGRLSFKATTPEDVVAEDDTTTEPTSDVGAALIGLSVDEAKAYAAANNTDFRIGSIDGEFLPVTMDYRPGRITASIEKDIVVSYTVE